MELKDFYRNRKEESLKQFIELLKGKRFQLCYWVVKIKFFDDFEKLKQFVTSNEDELHLLAINEQYNCISFLKNYPNKSQLSFDFDITHYEKNKSESKLFLSNKSLLDICIQKSSDYNTVYLRFKHSSEFDLFYPKQEHLYFNDSQFYSCVNFLLKAYAD